ncbi:MAG: uracil-xanthine permease family protein [Deltaproteobacteria bacterium]|jgi:uracil permease|nr:uracil-xanthine permease family protein [Deltaproteobacteria bacterium]
MSKNNSTISSLDYSFNPRHALIGSQMFFVAFGALVLVPLLTGLNPSVAMFTAGLGTLAFQIITKGRVPIFLASSFAFILPIQQGIAQWGLPATLCGLVASGILYMLLSFLVLKQGVRIIERFLPSIVTGPVIMVIGLSLAPVGVNMAFGNGTSIPPETSLTIAMISLGATILATIWGRGLIKLIPIICGIVVGYAVSLGVGIVDFAPVKAAPWLAIPDFTMPEWNWQAVLYIVPIAIAPAIEHVGNVFAISAVTGRDYTKDPGLHRTLLGDGVATMLASFVGGPPNTTYAEVTGGVVLTRAFNPGVMTWAAISAICLAFVGKLGALLMTIPVPVMGGIMILLFGAIVVVGMNSLAHCKQDLTAPRNMVIISVIMVFGLGGMVIGSGDLALKGIGLAGISGLLLHLIIPGGKS